MTVIVTMLLYVFGLNTTTGNLDYTTNTDTNVTTCGKDAEGNIIIYDPNYDPLTNPVYYQSPNIIVPKPNYPKNPPSGSSDPAYQS